MPPGDFGWEGRRTLVQRISSIKMCAQNSRSSIACLDASLSTCVGCRSSLPSPGPRAGRSRRRESSGTSWPLPCFPCALIQCSGPWGTFKTSQSFKILTPGPSPQSDFELQVRPGTEDFKTPQVILMCCGGQALQPQPWLAWTSPLAGEGAGGGCGFFALPGHQGSSLCQDPKVETLRGPSTTSVALTAFLSRSCVSHVWTWWPVF